MLAVQRHYNNRNASTIYKQSRVPSCIIIIVVPAGACRGGKSVPPFPNVVMNIYNSNISQRDLILIFFLNFICKVANDILPAK